MSESRQPLLDSENGTRPSSGIHGNHELASAIAPSADPQDGSQTGIVGAAMSIFQSATSWMAADMQEAPVLRSAPAVSIPTVFDAETQALVTEEDGETESALTAPISVRPSFDRSASRRASMSRAGSMARDDGEYEAPTGYAAAIEAAQDILDIDPPSVPYPEPPSLPPDTAEAIAAQVEELMHIAEHAPLAAGAAAVEAAAAAAAISGGRFSPSDDTMGVGGSLSAAMPPRLSSAVMMQSDTPSPGLGNDGKAVTRTQPAKSTAAGGHTLPPPSLVNDFVVGVVNAVIALPITAAYLPIVYSAAVYAPHLPLLTRLLFLANAAIQASMAALSSLPFAIGQVQDLGLIFLNAMTKDIAATVPDPDRALATALLSCAVATAALGVCLIIVGRQQLGGLVAYIPLPVVAGYLGYLGYFCVAAAFAQVTALPISAPPSFYLLIIPANFATIPNSLALIACCAVMMVGTRVWRSPAALPTILVAIPAFWYAVLAVVAFASGVPWADMMEWLQDHHWVERPPAEPAGQPFWNAFELLVQLPLSLDSIAWGALARQLPTMAVVCLVCSLGTSMDVMAIQTEVPWELDTDIEITALGVGNLLAGVVGLGGPGSIIFSQSVLAIRSGVRSRLQGLTLAAAQLAMFVLPFSLVHYLPNFYYGALLAVLGIDICREWLWNTRTRIKAAEFVLSWLSFTATITLTSLMPVQGLEAGIAVGIVMCALHFAYEYSVLQLVTFTVSPSRSTAMLPYRHRQMLSLFQGNVVAVSLSGYVFFGSMVEIGKRLKATAALLGTRSVPDLISAAGLDPDGDGGPGSLAVAAAAATAAAHRFLLLDLRAVVGIDATTASSFALLRRSLETRGVTMVLTGLRADDGVTRLLQSNGVIAKGGAWESGYGCPAFESFDAALVWCEEHFMKVAAASGLVDDLEGRTLRLEDVVAMHAADAGPSGATGGKAGQGAAAAGGKSTAAIAKKLGQYLVPVEFVTGEVLFDFGDAADSIFLVLGGSVVSVLDFLSSTEVPDPEAVETNTAEAVTPRRSPSSPGGRMPPTPTSPISTPVPDTWQAAAPSAHGKVRLASAGPGSVLGALDFVLRRPRSNQCLAVTDGSALLLSREKFSRMASADPHAYSMLQQIMLRSSLLTTSTTQQAMERAVQCAFHS
eukprot:jgi/Ulvmu1/9699/UM055_0037.1